MVCFRVGCLVIDTVCLGSLCKPDPPFSSNLIVAPKKQDEDRAVLSIQTQFSVPSQWSTAPLCCLYLFNPRHSSLLFTWPLFILVRVLKLSSLLVKPIHFHFQGLTLCGFVGSNAWLGWRSLRSALRSSCCRPTIRRNGPGLPFLWTLRSEYINSLQSLPSSLSRIHTHTHAHTLAQSSLDFHGTGGTQPPVWPTDHSTSWHALNLPILVSAGSFCSFWSQGALLEGVWVQAQLQWPWCDQMGAVHRPLWHLWNSLLKFSPTMQHTDHFSSRLIFFFFLLLLPTLSLSSPQSL